jgi:O-antigen ligase
MNRGQSDFARARDEPVTARGSRPSPTFGSESFPPDRRVSEPRLDARRVSLAALLALPAGLTAYFSFNSGGFYPGPPAYAAMILSVVLVLRVTMAENPFEGFSWPLAVAAGTLSSYALLTLLSGAWSHAPGRAVVEFDLPLIYLLAIVLFGSIAHTRERLEWMLRLLALAILVVCTCALITRVLPHLWPTTPDIANNRLSFPVSYWNALGLLAVLGMVLCVHLTSDVREPAAGRVAAAAALPILTTTLFFTFSRGAIASGVVAITTYALVGRPRALLSLLLSAVPATAVAIKFAYDANLLATPTATTAPAAVQGRHVAIAVLVCVVGAGVLRALLLPLDARLERFALPAQVRRRTVRTAWISLAAAALIAITALNGAIVHQYHRFVRASAPSNAVDLRARLTDPGNNGRIDMWHVAWRQFTSAPLVGHGAGTFANSWAQQRPTTDFVQDAHSLYLEVLDELGVVGLLLVLTAVLTVLVRVATRARGPNRPIYGAVFAVLLAWAIHAGWDWDWEMPVITLVFFALGGFALAAPLDRAGLVGAPSPRARTLLGLGCLLLAVAPAYVWLSQRKLDDAAYSFSQRDCAAAIRAADSSISILGIRPEPYEILGYCDIRRDMPNLALAAINKAISLDPGNWNYHYDLALMRAAAGLDPRAAAREALSLNPREPLVQDAWRTFRSAGPSQWERDGKAIAGRFTSL